MDARELKKKNQISSPHRLPHAVCREMGWFGFSLRAILLVVSEGNRLKLFLSEKGAFC